MKRSVGNEKKLNILRFTFGINCNECFLCFVDLAWKHTKATFYSTKSIDAEQVQLVFVALGASPGFRDYLRINSEQNVASINISTNGSNAAIYGSHA